MKLNGRFSATKVSLQPCTVVVSCVFKETLTGRIRLINGGRKTNCNVVLHKRPSQREWKFSLSGNAVAMSYQPPEAQDKCQ